MLCMCCVCVSSLELLPQDTAVAVHPPVGGESCRHPFSHLSYPVQFTLPTNTGASEETVRTSTTASDKQRCVCKTLPTDGLCTFGIVVELTAHNPGIADIPSLRTHTPPCPVPAELHVAILRIQCPYQPQITLLTTGLFICTHIHSLTHSLTHTHSPWQLMAMSGTALSSLPQ